MSTKPATNASGWSGGDFWSAQPALAGRESFDPLAYFRTILQYKWPIIVATALTTALALAYVLTATPLYRSTQSLLLEPGRANIVGVEGLIDATPDEIGYVQTQIELLHSREVVRRVVDALELLAEPVFVAGLAEHAGVEPSRLSASVEFDAATDTTTAEDPSLGTDEARTLATDFLLSRLSVSEIPTTRLLRVGFLSPDPVLAANVANEVGRQYILQHVESNRTLIDAASGWLGESLAELKTTLDASEARLLAFKAENDLVSIDGGGVARLTEQGLLQDSSELNEARLQLSSVSDLLTELRADTSTSGLLSNLPALRTGPIVQQTRIEINRLRREIEGVSNQYGPLHPRRVELQSELEELQGSLEVALQQGIAGVENERRLLERKVASLESGLTAGRRAIQDVDVKSIELAALESEVQANRDLYYRFFGRMTESRSTQGLDPVNATVIERAVPALRAAKPDKAFIVLLTAIGTLFCATVAAMIVSGLDDSIRRPSSIEEKLGTRLLGIVPVHRAGGARRARTKAGAAAHENSERRFLESFRTVRTNLVLEGSSGASGHTGDRKIILLTSSVPKEGKSMSSVCLARSFAQIERVLLIDADLRRPSLAKALKLDPEAAGLSTLLDGGASLPDIVHHHRTGGFDVLPSGPATDRALELLSSRRFEELLRELSGSYDRIIVDCAPLEAVSDALALSRLSDAVVYVVKSNDTSQRLVARGLAKLRGAGAPLVGVLLTQVDIAKLTVYGGDEDFHGYYGYYDYAANSARVAGPASEGRETPGPHGRRVPPSRASTNA